MTYTATVLNDKLFFLMHTESSMVVAPRHWKLYEYSAEDAGDRIIVALPHLEDVDADDISITMDGQNIVCQVSDDLPFFAGHLVGPLKETPKVTPGEGVLFITMLKLEPTRWELFIDGPKSDDVIDPQSAYTLYQHEVENGNVEEAEAYMRRVVSQRFPRALIDYGSALLESDRKEQGMDVLKMVCEVYDDPRAYMTRAMQAVADKDFEEARNGLQILANQGLCTAKVMVAEMYSPAETPMTGFEDAARAIAIFESVPETAEEYPYALYGLAKIAMAGYDPKRSNSEGKKLYKRAVELERDIPKIPVDKVSMSTVVGAGIAVALAAVGIVAFFHRKKR